MSVKCKVIKVGDVINNIKVVSQTTDYIPPGGGPKVSQWLCECLDCGMIIKKAHHNIKRCGYHHCDYYGPKHHNWKGYGEISSVFFCNIKKHAKTKKLIFDITIEQIWDLFIQQNRQCALSGIPLEISSKRKTRTASLDRIDSTKGYTIDNIQWTHKILNNMKSNMPNQEFINWCKLIADTHG